MARRLIKETTEEWRRFSQKLNGMFGELYTALIPSVTATIVGDVTYADLNSADEGVTDIDIVFTGAKPAGSYIDKLFFKNQTAFSKTGESYDGGSIESISIKEEETTIAATGGLIPLEGLGNITVSVKLDAENTKDWLSGSIQVFAVFKTYPTLSH